MSVDHYQTLGVSSAATASDLRAAYLELARANHPDKFEGGARGAAETRMQQINEAWNVLGVAHKRREYDAARPAEARATPGQSRTQRGHAHFRPFADDTDWHSGNAADIDYDTTPIAGSKNMPRWMAFVPVVLFIAGIVTMAFGTMVNAAGVFALGLIALGFGAVCFLMLPLVVMSRAEKDPEL